MPRGILSEKSAVFFLWYNCIGKCTVNVLNWMLFFVRAAGNPDLTSLMVGRILCMLWSLATAFVNNLFTKVLSGISASSVKILKS